MTVQYYISTWLFALFILLVAGRTIAMRHKGIRAFVFGATDKSDFLLIPCIMLIVYTIIARTFGLPMWEPLVMPFWNTHIFGWVGIALCTVAVGGIAASLISFGNSFRIGIDEKEPDKLITTGMFAFSRNPIYVCFILFFFGMFLIHRNIVITSWLIFFTLIIHRQILREERFLSSHYGTDYDDYCRKVRRYL